MLAPLQKPSLFADETRNHQEVSCPDARRRDHLSKSLKLLEVFLDQKSFWIHNALANE